MSLRATLACCFVVSMVIAFCFSSALAQVQSIERIKPGAVIYGIVPPLFGDPPLKSVTSHLKRLQSLGVDVLWLLPIHASDDIGSISYSITDYFRLRDDFGTEEDLRHLTAKAHSLGMKVVLDFVPNHTSAEHPFFKSGQSRGPMSPYYFFYERDSSGNPTHYFDWIHLKNLNFTNPAVAKLMTDAFLHWVRLANVDGYRVDAAWGIERRTPQFFPNLVEAIRKEKPNALMIAEASRQHSNLIQAGFDIAYDWTKNLGEWPLQDAFESPERAGKILRRVLQSEKDSGQTLRFLNNNDTGARFISQHGPWLTRAATIFHLTLLLKCNYLQAHNTLLNLMI